ncbi:DNA/RNA non-specific endonuclease [Luteimonas yindakuii]|uniref:DNA/RNA non-specific endonuclease n=1 Tax=Luteimonas yindakuii TaxID=2565782 RepID=UPI00142230F2|nr:DNA/RNA non-specific endonuclease [Luteimonas yindakuii]
MSIDASRDASSFPGPLPDWLSGLAAMLQPPAARFGPDVLATQGRDVAFEHDPASTRISNETGAGQRSRWDASTEVSVAVAEQPGAPVRVHYQADMPRSAATPEAMRSINPLDPGSWPPGTRVELAGGDHAGTPFEATFRNLADANGVESIDDVRLVMVKTTETRARPVAELRVMSGPASVFAAPTAHGPGSPVLDREDFSVHTLVQRDPGHPDQRAALNHLLVSGTLPDGTVGVAETVSPGSINALVSDVASGEVNDVTWTFDDEGRPLHAEGTLTWLPGSGSMRDTDSVENRAQSGFRVDNGLDRSEHTGHIFAYRFVHGHGAVNMFPQNGNFNTGAYARLEQEWADWLDAGMDVDIRVELAPSGALRPDQVVVDYAVTDPASGSVVYDPATTVFENAAGQVFDSLSRAEIGRLIADIA